VPADEQKPTDPRPSAPAPILLVPLLAGRVETATRTRQHVGAMRLALVIREGSGSIL
jgi:hypothetical protein